ncbi:hypothetical protein HDU76_000230 [Blyttiomyces sp. JEL0837]|nr:hypothetical protein HDU76_000230 [Blyttiomyces sp. JEL0837]
MLEVRLRTLQPNLDHIIIAESKFTFTGLSKQLYFDEFVRIQKEWFPDFWELLKQKIVHVVLPEVGEIEGDGDDYEKEHVDSWDREFMYRKLGLELGLAKLGLVPAALSAPLFVAGYSIEESFVHVGEKRQDHKGLDADQ